MEYQQNIDAAAKSHPSFDRVNAKEIGDYHGEDPKRVLKDIKALRSVGNRDAVVIAVAETF